MGGIRAPFFIPRSGCPTSWHTVHPSPQSGGPGAYNDSMNKTPDLNAIMADYTQQVIAEERRRQAIRDAAAADPQAWFAKWEATRPQGQWGRWHISDRD